MLAVFKKLYKGEKSVFSLGFSLLANSLVYVSY